MKRMIASWAMLLGLMGSLAAQSLRLVADIYPGPRSGGPLAMVPLGQRLYLFVEEHPQHGPSIWSMDEAGSLRFEANFDGIGGPIRPHVIGQQIFFPNSHWLEGNEVAVFDASTQQLRRLPALRPGQNAGWQVNRMWEEVVGNQLVFVGRTDAESPTLYACDGQTYTRLLSSTPGTVGIRSVPGNFNLGQRALFDVLVTMPQMFNSYLLVSTDGTPAGTQILDTAGVPHQLGPGSTPSRALFYKSGQYFETDGLSVWPHATLHRQGGLLTALPVPGGHAYMTMNRPWEFWLARPNRSDTLFHTDAWVPVEYKVMNQRTAFIARGNHANTSFWATDGTPAGTGSLYPATFSEPPAWDTYTASDEWIAWAGREGHDTLYQNELYISRGIPGDAIRLNINPDSGSQPWCLTPWRGKLYFTAFQAASGHELYELSFSPNFLPQPSSRQDWRIYPNPTQHSLHLADPQQQVLGTPQVYSAAGVEISLFWEHPDKTWQASVAHLPSGLYQIRWQTGSGHLSQSWIKTD